MTAQRGLVPHVRARATWPPRARTTASWTRACAAGGALSAWVALDLGETGDQPRARERAAVSRRGLRPGPAPRPGLGLERR